MIKHDGVDIPRIEYIDPVDGKVSILIVMKDGVQIWPDGTPPVKPNIPTGIQLSEYEVVANIEWDYTKMYIGEGDNVNLVTLYFTGQDADITSVPGNLDWVLYPFNVINTVTVYTDRVELLVNTPFTSASSVTIDYTPGVNPLKDIDGHLLTALNNQPLDNVLPVGYTYILDDYPGAAAAYSLRKLKTGVVQGIMVRRDSDDQLVDVRLYDDPSKSIDLDSITESGGQTLGEWVGGASAFIFNWYDQSGSGNHASQSTEANQPMVINAGVLEVLNNKTSLRFDGTSQFLVSNTFTLSAQPVTRIGVSIYRGVANGRYFIDGSASNRSVIGSAPTTPGNWRLYAGSVSDYAPSPTIDTQYLQFAVFNGASSNLQINGSNLGNKNVGTHGLDKVTIGVNGSTNSSQYFAGSAQEVICYPDDQTANRTDIETDINDHYNIYVVTSEVDAQLIQADTDNVSDTVIEINGVRSSASDTAVANLISRNNTVITN